MYLRSPPAIPRKTWWVKGHNYEPDAHAHAKYGQEILVGAVSVSGMGSVIGVCCPNLRSVRFSEVFNVLVLR